MERKLLSLHVKYGGMGVVVFCDIAKNENNNSRAVTASLVKLQLEQTAIYRVNREEILDMRNIKNIKLDKY